MTVPALLTRHDLDRDGLAALLEGEAAYRVGQVWDGLYQRLLDPAEMTDLPKALRARLDDALPRALTPVVASESDAGDTVKWLWALPDGARIETVVMAYRDRVTVCVSSQAGCAMACGFCATGQAGFERHLTAGEMVEQVVVAARWSR
ncbi:MAG: 23S rRNA (adenine(2503)-C(2))-methyltransferase RlmN, partial [Acidimicrobiia bacterium]|nr:23S rRNA (adenine(2503)-C(2))-methyltransferase RlmN [Acidimicrobiia bacterium]